MARYRKRILDNKAHALLIYLVFRVQFVSTFTTPMTNDTGDITTMSWNYDDNTLRSGHDTNNDTSESLMDYDAPIRTHNNTFSTYWDFGTDTKVNSNDNWMFAMPAIPSMAGVVANSVVLVGILYKHQGLTNHFLLIINLCISDILLAVSWSTAILLIVLTGYLPPSYDCAFNLASRFHVVGHISTILTIMAMAVDHYVAIICPLKYQIILTKKRVIGCLIVIWLFSVTISSIKIIIGVIMSINNGDKLNTMICSDQYVDTRFYFQYELYFETIVIIASILIMFFVYIRILFEIRRSVAFTRDMVGQNQSGDLRRNKRVITTTMLVLGTFVTAWVPFVVAQYNELLTDGFDYRLALISNYLFKAMPGVNTLCDPVIYAIRLIKIRTNIKRAFGCHNPDAPANGNNDIVPRTNLSNPVYGNQAFVSLDVAPALNH
jgi:hypothetical protein